MYDTAVLFCFFSDILLLLPPVGMNSFTPVFSRYALDEAFAPLNIMYDDTVSFSFIEVGASYDTRLVSRRKNERSKFDSD